MVKTRKAHFGILLMLTSGCYFGLDDLDRSPGQADGETTNAPNDTDGDATTPSDDDDPTDDASTSDGSDGPEPTFDCLDEEQWFKNTLESSCSGCHGPALSEGDFGNVTDIFGLVRDQRIIGGDPDESELYQRITGQTDLQIMPPAGPLDQASIDRIATYIGECATLPPCENAGEVLDLDAQMKLMADDIRTIERDERPNIRYLTLTHFHNAGYCSDQIQPWRDAITHAVNALSTEPNIALPKVVEGSFDTIYRIDMRDYGWDEVVTTIVDTDDPLGNGERPEALTFEDKWDLMCFDMLKAYVPDAELGDGAAGDLQADADQGCVSLMGDEFVFRAMQPPTVHDVLELPLTIQETDLKFLTEPRTVQQEELKVVRAGLADSGVSLNNRLVERLQQPDGRYYWVSYDFAAQQNREENLFESPIGPADPFQNLLVDEDRFFVEAGGEALIQLPNGLMVGMLYTSPASAAAGIRLNKAPTNIVQDKQTDDGAVLNETSCLTCHENGLLAFDDEILPNVENNRGLVDGETLQVMREIYPDSEVFRQIVKDDSESYLEAKEDLEIELDPPVDAIFANYRFYTFLPVATDLVRGEIGFDENALRDCIEGIDAWNPLDEIEGGFVPRAVLDARFDDCIQILGLGVPVSQIALENL